MKFKANRRNTPRLALLGFALIGGGCGGANDGPTVYPVSGKILVNGRPAAKAKVTFHPAAGSPIKMIPFAETDDDGSFRPSTRLTQDGAPAGDYTLTIIWPEIRNDRGEEIAGRDRLRGKYGDPRGSNLKVTIKEGENSLLPFELKSSR